jgi:hypothetical protein
MSPSLSASAWSKTFAYYRNHAYDDVVKSMAAMLEDIALYIDDPRLGEIFDTYARHVYREDS